MDNLSNRNIEHIINQLCSSKQRDRNQALDSLTDLLRDNPNKIPNNSISIIIESLILLLDSEQKKFIILQSSSPSNSYSSTSSNKLKLSESKLTNISYIIRLFIEKTSNRLKVKSLQLCFTSLLDLIYFDNSGELIELISIHISYSLISLIRSEIFSLRFPAHSWVSLIDQISSIIIDRTKLKKINDKIMLNFITCLIDLLKNDTVAIKQIKYSLIFETLFHYFDLINFENSNTELIIELAKIVIIKFNLTNINMTISLIGKLMKHILNINNTSNQKIQLNLNFIHIFTSELIPNHLPLMTKNSHINKEIKNVISQDSLFKIFQEYLILMLVSYKSNNISIDYIRIILPNEVNSINEKVSWFQFNDFALAENHATSNWLCLLGLVKLINSYFIFKGRICGIHEQNLITQLPQLFKRRKFEPSFTSILLNSESIDEFFVNCLEINVENINLISLQILSFHSSLFFLNSHNFNTLKDLILQKYEKSFLINWVCLTLISLISKVSFTFTNDDANKLLKICLPLIKDPKYCKMSTALLLKLSIYSYNSDIGHSENNNDKINQNTNPSNKIVLDTHSRQRMLDLYELSEVNGPALFSNESFQFWIYFQYIGKDFLSTKRLTSGDCIWAWINSKINQQCIPLFTASNKSFSRLVIWLWDMKVPVADSRFVYCLTITPTWLFEEWKLYYEVWTKYEKQRKFLLQNTQKANELKKLKLMNPISNCRIHRDELFSFLSKIYPMIPELKVTYIEKVNIFFELLSIVFTMQFNDFVMSNDTGLFSDFYHEFKDFYTPFVKSLNDSNYILLRHLRKILPFMLTEPLPDFIFSELLLSDAEGNDYVNFIENEPNIVSLKQKTVIEKSFEVLNKSVTKNFSISETFNKYSAHNTSLIIQTVIAKHWRLQEHNNNHVLSEILQLSKRISTEKFLEGFDTFISWLSSIDNKFSFDSDLLVKITEVIGSHILNSKYNTSSEVMTMLCMYLDSLRPQWLLKTELHLNADCNDIFEWIIERFKDNSFSGNKSIEYLSKLLLNMLIYHDLSNNIVKGSKQRVFMVLIECFKKINLPTVAILSSKLGHYMNVVSIKNQQVILQELSSIFHHPQRSMEYSSFFSLSMLNLASSSNTNLPHIIENMLSFTTYPHMKFYISSMLHSVASSLKLTTMKDLFDHFKYEVLISWAKKLPSISKPDGDSSDLETICDISLFGFEKFSDFIRLYATDFISVYYATACTNTNLLELILQTTQRTASQLLQESMHICLPLAYLPTGIHDTIFPTIKNVIGKKLTTIIQENALLISRRILKSTEFLVIEDIQTTLKKLHRDDELSYLLFVKYSKSSKYRSPLKIDFPSSISLLNKIFKANFQSSDIDITCLWILDDLKKSSQYYEKLGLLRELKYIFCSYLSSFFSSYCLTNVLYSLSELSVDRRLYDEIFPLMLVTLKFSYESNFNIGSSFTASFSSIIMFFKEGEYMSLAQDFLKLLKSIDRRRWTNLRSNEQEILKYATIMLDTPSSDELNFKGEYLIDLLLQEKEYTKYSSQLIASIVLNSSSSNAANITPNTHGLQKILLYPLSNPYNSTSYQLFTKKYITNYVRNGGEIFVDVDKPHAINWNYTTIFEQMDPLLSIFECFYSFRKTLRKADDHHITLKFIIECIFSTYFNTFTKDSQSQNINITKLFIEEAQSSLMNKHALEAIFPRIISINRTFSKDYYNNKKIFDKSIKYCDWILELVNILLVHLESYCPSLLYLLILLKTSISFQEKIFPILFFAFISFDAQESESFVLFVTENFGTLAGCVDSIPKAQVILSMIAMLRTGYISGVRPFISIYKKVNLRLIYKNAISANELLFAYMLFEEVNMEQECSLDILNLKNIYEGINDIELLSGLPASMSINGVIASLNKTNQESWRTFLFNNALLDSSANQQDNFISSAYSNSLESNGFINLALSLQNATNVTDESNIYDWSIQLRNWDLPIPHILNTTSKAQYAGLKKIVTYGVNSITELDNLFDEVYYNIKHFAIKNDWLNSLSELNSIKEHILQMNNSHPNNFCETQIHTESITFKDFKSHLITKYTTCLLLAESSLDIDFKLRLKQYIHASFYLGTFVQKAIDNQSIQDSIKASILLENIRDTLNNVEEATPYLPFMNRYVDFNAALALWESGEFKTPILKLKNLLENPVSLDNIGSEMLFLMKPLEIRNDSMKAYLVEWSSHSRYESPSLIYKNYINSIDTTSKDQEKTAMVFQKMGDFLLRQVQQMKSSGQIEERNQICKKSTASLNKLSLIYNKGTLTTDEKKETKQQYMRIKQQNIFDLSIVNNLKEQYENFNWFCLEFFMNAMILSDTFDDELLDKFCSLWFENDKNNNINRKLYDKIANMPTWKFLSWTNQIASKLSIEETAFQKPLRLIMERIIFKFPYDSLYAIMNIRLHKSYLDGTHSDMSQKIEAVERIMHRLKRIENGKFYATYVTPIEIFCNEVVKLANLKISKNTRSINLENIKIGKYWLVDLLLQKIPLPTAPVTIKCSQDGKSPRAYITSIKSTLIVSATGLSLPKIVSFTQSDGLQYKVLMKGSKDDLKQDSVMEQAFQKVNHIFASHKKLRAKYLKIRTYEVIPLDPGTGMIEFVRNSISLHEILNDLHKGDELTFNKARSLMKNAQNKTPSEKVACFKELTDRIKPQLRKFFFNAFLHPDDWFSAKMNYTKGVAVTSIIGFVLGLGDRHLNNILIDSHSGEPIHIDLGIAFDQGRLLPIPETIPFRLTRDIINGFGVTGVEGLFRKNCEYTYSVLRENHQKFLSVMNLLKWDPLYSWVMSPMRKHRHLVELNESMDETNFHKLVTEPDTICHSEVNNDEEANDQSLRAINTIEEKLVGNGLSVESTVQELIQQATDETKLAQLFFGWSPFY